MRRGFSNGKKGFKKDLPALPPYKFFHVYIINKVSYGFSRIRSGACNFSSVLKNSLVQVNSKSCDYLLITHLNLCFVLYVLAGGAATGI